MAQRRVGRSKRAGGERSRPGNGGGCSRRCWRSRTAGCCRRSPSTAPRQRYGQRSGRRFALLHHPGEFGRGTETIAFDKTGVQDAADDHPDQLASSS